MSRFNFISGLEKESDNPSKKFQVFEAEMGFEKVSVLIPFENSEAFEKDALQAKPKSTTSLMKLVQQHGGKRA